MSSCDDRKKTSSSPDNVQYSRILHVVVVTTMRVHLRGVVISVGVLLSLVVMVAVFNAYDSSSSSQVRGRQPGRSGGRMALRAADDSSDAAASGSRAKKSAAPRARSRSALYLINFNQTIHSFIHFNSIYKQIPVKRAYNI